MRSEFGRLFLVLALCLVSVAAVREATAQPAPSVPSTAASSDFTVVDSLDALRPYLATSGAKIRLKPGTYRLDRATQRHFLVFSGTGSHWDFRGVTLEIDTTLFQQRLPVATDGSEFYCALSLTGDRITLEGLTTHNLGDRAGVQGKNKIINITGSDVVVRNVDVTTSGSAPWGYGSMFGIGGGDVKKMNGIRIGWPARNVLVTGCRVHMRAMGHGVFIQGAQGTRIENCQIDGLLRLTDEILAEKSGYAFARKFRTPGRTYSEGVTLGAQGEIRPGEIISLSEDGIRLYDRGGPNNQPTGSTTIVNCTVIRMRRGICTGLGPAADRIVNCEVRECVAAGFNLGSGDILEGSRADARYSEALSIPYLNARNVRAELTVLDSRQVQANNLLAVINGRDHRVALHTDDSTFVPVSHLIALGSGRGYAFYQDERGDPAARGVDLVNETAATVELSATASGNTIHTTTKVNDLNAIVPANRVLK